MTAEQSLLDLLSIQMGCMYLSNGLYVPVRSAVLVTGAAPVSGPKAGVADAPGGGCPGVERRAGLPGRSTAGGHGPGRKGAAGSLVISAL